MNEFIIFFLLIIISLIVINKFNQNKNIILVKSNIDNRKYLVRKEKTHKIYRFDKLANINIKIQKIIEKANIQERDNVNLLKDNYNPDALSETVPGSRYTSYAVNKGEKIALCIRHIDKTFMDDNTILFVIIHELGHVMSLSVGHTEEFWSNMKFLLEQAESINLYVPVDYSQGLQNIVG